MRASAACFAVLWIAAVAPGCLASTVMTARERSAPATEAEVRWRPAQRADVLGYFESEAIEGEAAASLWKVYYHFAEDGSYSGAALVRSEEGAPQFQTLNGSWDLVDGTLSLDAGEPARASSDEERLKIEASGGSLILRRKDL